MRAADDRGDVTGAGGNTDRDDRTLRTLSHVLGAEAATVALTHFVRSRVDVAVSAVTLEASNGWTAVRLALNMLSRFVGASELCVFGDTSAALDARIDAELASLSRIDTREGRSVARGTGIGTIPCAAILCIGENVVASCGADLKAVADGHDIPPVIVLGFDAWTCHVMHGASAELPVTASSVPFGAMAGVCFGVSEVFKVLIASAADPVDVAKFERRFTREWHYSVWTQERLDADTGGVSQPTAQDPLPPLALEGVLQVGAGAVGNASAFALAETPALTGTIPVLDVKTVDAKNLNRCLYFREPDVTHRKVDVLAREASRARLKFEGVHESYSDERGRGARIVLSTVDNNDVRHQMQETLPAYIVEGSTGGTQIAVSLHTAVDGRTCLVCKHPDRSLGIEARRPLSVTEAATLTGLSDEAIGTGMVSGSTEITDAVLALVRANAPKMAEALQTARDEGRDLCGALGDLRTMFGVQDGPREASIPFVSALAGVLAAAEVVKLQLRRVGNLDVPVLDNMVQLDLARDYSRPARASGAYPATTDCPFCQGRREGVRLVYAAKCGEREREKT